MNRIAILGAGRVGLGVGRMLADRGYPVIVADCTEEALGRASANGLEGAHVDFSRPESVARFVEGAGTVVAAAPDRLVPRIAEAAVAAGTHYLDFCEPARETRNLAERSADGRAFLAGCGVSPGLADSIAFGLSGRLDPRCDVDMRVGAIPALRTNRLGYGLIWNLDGLIAEYTQPCTVLADGEITTLPALSGREDIVIDGVEYEAFLTAGSIETLVGLAAPQMRSLVYRTIRYRGHLDYMLFLLDDLGLRGRRDLLATVLGNGLPSGQRDIVLVEVVARGMRGGRGVTEKLTLRIDPGDAQGQSALALASAAHAAALVEMIDGNMLDARAMRNPALVPHESVLGSRFFEGLIAR